MEMAETIKKTGSKSRKSRNDMIRTALGMYLKQKKYSFQDKFRKSDLSVAQSMDQYDVNMMVDDDVAKVNSISYSNVLCLSNNQSTVELQFSKFVKFVQSQRSPTVKSELQMLLWPLLCHIYIEMVKGKDPKPAADFLRKYAHLVGPVESLHNPVINKCNGNMTSDNSQSSRQSVSPPLPSSSTQILFASEKRVASNGTSPPSPNSDTELNISPNIQDYFKELIQSLSICMRIDEIESMEIVRNFRYAKYETELSLQALYAIKNFLSKNGHVIILHILQTWFSFEVREALLDSDIDEQDADESNDVTDTPNSHTNISENRSFDADENSNSDQCEQHNNAYQEIRNLLDRMNLEIKTINRLRYRCGSSIDIVSDISTEMDNTSTAVQNEALRSQQIESVVENKYLQNVRASVIRSHKLEMPMRVFQFVNVDDQLSSADIDPLECHLIGGFDDSTVKLWQLNHSRIVGHKPYSPFSQRLCEWCLDNSTAFDNENDTEDLQDTCQSKDEKYTERMHANSCSITLRGHSMGVTNVVLSKHSPLIFSVSKDKTMRAWKACDYKCGAIYRGHNYAIWCVAESSTGQYVATGSRDLTARLWCTDREHPLQTYIGHTQDVDAIAFHPNGNYIATGSTDLTVRLWDVTSGKLLRVFIDCHLPIHCVSFSPDGKYLAAAGEETKIRIFDLAAGSQLFELKDHSAVINNIAWNWNGSKMVSGCADGSVRVYTLNKITQASTSSSPSSKQIMCNDTTCKRIVKTFFNSNDTVSCVGHS